MRKRPQSPDSVLSEPLVKPTSDLFTAVLWSAPKNEPLLRDFLNAVLTNDRQPPIREATVLNPFNIKEFAVDKKLILDVHVRDEASRRYNFEVQTASHPAFCDRMLFQWADFYSSQLRTGDDYTDLVLLKSVILTDFPIFAELQDLHTVFEVRARENPEVLLSDHFQMHFLRLGDLRKRQMEGLEALHVGLQHWLNFFMFGAATTEDRMSRLVENSPAVMAAYGELRRFSENAEMRELERRRRRYREDWQIGMTASRAEGKAEEKLEIALAMKRKGYDTVTIADLTGLSLAKIERLN